MTSIAATIRLIELNGAMGLKLARAAMFDGGSIFSQLMSPFCFTLPLAQLRNS